ncbi:MAG: precorrin-2 dehydrogenase/sirohydrochlorin ferrochelatase family protein [Bacillota bacterium]
MESFCPLHIDLKGRKGLVIGGGSVAERKVKTLLAYGADLTVVSPELNPSLKELTEAGEVSYINDIYRPAYLQDMFLVICATSDEEVNRQAADHCIKRGILVNSVSEPEYCTFFFPALLKKGPLTVAVSTAGSSPAISRRIKEQLDGYFGPEYEEYISFLGEMRPRIIARIKDKEARRDFFECLAGNQFFKKFKEKSRPEIDDLVEEMLAEIETAESSSRPGEGEA